MQFLGHFVALLKKTLRKGQVFLLKAYFATSRNKIAREICFQTPYKKSLTTISVSVIIYISYADITEVDTLSNHNNALTEAVFYILLSLQEPLHGYGIMQKVHQLSKGRLTLAAGTLYGAIRVMIEKRWIVSESEEKGSRKKEYQITDLGKDVLHQELVRLEELVANGRKLVADYDKGGTP